MKKLKYIYSILFLGIIFLMNSCDDPGIDIILDRVFVEINEATTSGGSNVQKQFLRLNDGIARRDSIRINLVGPHRSTPVTVNFQIGENSTAVAGVHYNMITTGTSVQIPANSSFAYIRFQVLVDNINPGEIWNLNFTLTGVDASGVELSENFKTFTRGLRISCPSDLAGTYSYTTINAVGGPGSNPGNCVNVSGTGTLTQISAGVYEISDASFGLFGCLYGDTPARNIRMRDVCQEIDFTGSDQYGDTYSVEIISNNGTDLVIDFINSYGDGGRATLTRTDSKTWPLGLFTN